MAFSSPNTRFTKGTQTTESIEPYIPAEKRAEEDAKVRSKAPKPEEIPDQYHRPHLPSASSAVQPSSHNYSSIPASSSIHSNSAKVATGLENGLDTALLKEGDELMRTLAASPDTDDDVLQTIMMITKVQNLIESLERQQAKFRGAADSSI